MNAGPFPMGKKRFAALVAVLSFGLTTLFTVLELGVLIPATFVVGFFIVLPLVAVLGDDFPGVESESEAESVRESVASDRVAASDSDDQIERLRERYARGEIDEAEFERRIERLLETKDLEREVGGTERQRELDLE